MNLLQECENAGRIGIGGHIRPDGDCVGSCLALYRYLKSSVPDAYVKVFLEEPPAIFSELEGYDEIDCTFEDDSVFDVFFVLDSIPERLGKSVKYIETAHKTVNIDHHISNPGNICTVNYVNPEVGSTSELIYDLVGEDNLDVGLAKSIYTGIIHDTGVFQYSNTTPETLRKAAKLISFGFDFPRLIGETFYERTYMQTQLLGRTLMESIRFMDGRCIVSYMDRKTMDFYNAVPADLDGIVNELRNIKGISCAIFMNEMDNMEFKVSMRSDEKVNVAEVAAYFGGGGHVRAAGCTMKGTFHDCVNNLSLHIARQLGMKC